MTRLLPLLLLSLAGCAAFEPPTVAAGHAVCMVGTCDHLMPILEEMQSPEFKSRVEAASPGVPRDVTR